MIPIAIPIDPVDAKNNIIYAEPVVTKNKKIKKIKHPKSGSKSKRPSQKLGWYFSD
jgi:hypothetical protein